MTLKIVCTIETFITDGGFLIILTVYCAIESQFSHMAANLSPHEQERLLSFGNFPIDVIISQIDLVKAGFTYNGHGDEVMCHACKLIRSGWKADDHPMVIHRLVSPACPFLNNRSDAYSCTGLERTERVPVNVNINTTYQTKRSEHHSNQPPGGGNGGGNSSLLNRFHSNNHQSHMQISDNNSLINEDDIYSAPVTSSQHRPFNSLRVPHSDDGSHILRGKSRAPREVQTESEVLPVPSDYRNNQNPNFSHENSNSVRGYQLKTPSIPPVSTTQTNMTVQRNNSLPQQQNVELPQRPILIEEPTPQQNPYNMSEISNSLPQNTPIDNTNQPYMVRSNDEAMELVGDLQQQTEAREWYTVRERPGQLNSYPPRLNFIDFEVRLNSFTGLWSRDSPVQPRELAEAGLYYTGPNDRVQCAWCRGGLLGWEPNDTAFGEHRRHFPQCWYVKEKLRALLEGQQFVPPPDPYPEDTGESLRTQLPRAQQQAPYHQLFNQTNPTLQQRMHPQPQPVVHSQPSLPYQQQNSMPNQPQTVGHSQSRLQNQQPNTIPYQPQSVGHNQPLLPYQQPNSLPNQPNLQSAPHQFNLQSPSDDRNQSVIGILQAMGYNLDIVTRAMQKLRRDTPVTTTSLLDMIFELEEEENSMEVGATGITHEEMDRVLDSGSTNQLAQNQMTGGTNSGSTNQVAQNRTTDGTYDPINSEIESLKKENERLRETTLCRVCMQNEVDMLFLPCRHIVTCEDCANRLRHCPLCRQPISGIVKTFLP